MSEDSHIFQQNQLPIMSFPIMEEIRRQGKLCDVTIKVENECFRAHRIVLAATIPYFNAMFTHDMLESKQNEITIQGMEPTAMEALINYAYSGRINIDPSNVQNLLVSASFLQLQDVRNACCEFLKRRLQPGNVLGIRKFADTLSCSSLVEASTTYLQYQFRAVSMSEEFKNLDLEEVLDIISKEELEISSEEKVFEAVIQWVKAEPEIRAKDLPTLLKQVRMPLLSPSYLTDIVAKEPFIKQNHSCRDLVDQAKDYHLLPERRDLMESFSTKPRCGPEPAGLIFAIGGLTKCGDSVSTVEVYDPLKGRWSTTEAMTMLRSRVGVAVMGRKLFAIGGYNGCERLSTVEVFNSERKTWSKVASMCSRRSAVGAAHLNGRLYVCGGYDGNTSLNTVESYDPYNDAWTQISPMLKCRSASGVVAFKGFVYALGGHDGLTIFDSVERYDPCTGSWSSVTPMLTKRCRLGVATLKGKLYVCGGYDGSMFLKTVECYDAASNKWSYVSPMNTTRSRVALVANQGKLWAIGGYDGVVNLQTVEMFDPEKDTWKIVAPMCAHEGGVGVGVIPWV